MLKLSRVVLSRKSKENLRIVEEVYYGKKLKCDEILPFPKTVKLLNRLYHPTDKKEAILALEELSLCPSIKLKAAYNTLNYNYIHSKSRILVYNNTLNVRGISDISNVILEFLDIPLCSAVPLSLFLGVSKSLIGILIPLNESYGTGDISYLRVPPVKVITNTLKAKMSEKESEYIPVVSTSFKFKDATEFKSHPLRILLFPYGIISSTKEIICGTTPEGIYPIFAKNANTGNLTALEDSSWAKLLCSTLSLSFDKFSESLIDLKSKIVPDFELHNLLVDTDTDPL